MDPEAWREEVESQDSLVTLAKKNNCFRDYPIFTNMFSLE